MTEQTWQSQDKMTEYKASFQFFDKDNDGRITKDELRIALRGLGQYPTECELDDMMAEVDKDGSGTVEFDEFVMMMQKRTEEINEEEHLRKSFKVFDKDGDGTISAKELRFVLTQLGEKLSDEEVQSMLSEADLDGDGALNYEEFVKMMTAS